MIRLTKLGPAGLALGLAISACGVERGDESGTAMATPAHAATIQDAPAVTVYKSPTCGCCAAWVEHMRAAGFEVEVEDTDELAAVKAEAGVPPQLQSCHTARIGEYVVEGHVPADVIARFLAEGSEARGLAVPGMPVGSPGMEMGDRSDPYDVLAFDDEGRSAVYESR